MDPNLSDKISGLLYGSLVDDALALGAHWIYDQDELLRDYGRVANFLDPRADSYHPTKKAGQQTHYGDQALRLLDSMARHGGFERNAFARDWEAMWTGYGDYLDHATKDTLAHLQAGGSPAAPGSASDELGGAARIAPLLAWLAGSSVEKAIEDARTQTAFTHGAPLATDAAEFLTRVVFALLGGSPLARAISDAAHGNYTALDLPEMLTRVGETDSLSTLDAARTLGLACPAPQALPTLLMLLRRHGDNFETAAIENVMAGGDNAARGLALGMILGAAHGRSAIPARWLGGLQAAPVVERFVRAFAFD